MGTAPTSWKVGSLLNFVLPLQPSQVVFPSGISGKTLPLTAVYLLRAQGWGHCWRRSPNPWEGCTPNSLPQHLGHQHCPRTPASLVSFVPSVSTASL